MDVNDSDFPEPASKTATNKAAQLAHLAFDPRTSTFAQVTPHMKVFKCKILGDPKPQQRNFASTKQAAKVHLWNPSRNFCDSFSAAVKQALQAANKSLFGTESVNPAKVTLHFFFPCQSGVTSTSACACLLMLPPLLPRSPISVSEINESVLEEACVCLFCAAKRACKSKQTNQQCWWCLQLWLCLCCSTTNPSWAAISANQTLAFLPVLQTSFLPVSLPCLSNAKPKHLFFHCGSLSFQCLSPIHCSLIFLFIFPLVHSLVCLALFSLSFFHIPFFPFPISQFPTLCAGLHEHRHPGVQILWLQQTATQKCSLQHSGRTCSVVQRLQCSQPASICLEALELAVDGSHITMQTIPFLPLATAPKRLSISARFLRPVPQLTFLCQHKSMPQASLMVIWMQVVLPGCADH